MNHHAAFTQFFSELKDPRQVAKIEYPFFDVVFLTVCAAIGGAHGWEDIELFGEAHLEWFQRNGLFPNGLPVHDTIARMYLFTRTGLTASVLPGWDNLSSRCTP